MERQHLKLMDMIAAIVGTLEKHEMFQSIISYSGRQHAQFGAKPLHFAAFGDALICGLEQQFGASFTPAGVERLERHAPAFQRSIYIKTGRFWLLRVRHLPE